MSRTKKIGEKKPSFLIKKKNEKFSYYSHDF